MQDYKQGGAEMSRRVGDRVVGKIGHNTREGKAFTSMIRRIQAEETPEQHQARIDAYQAFMHEQAMTEKAQLQARKEAQK